MKHVKTTVIILALMTFNIYGNITQQELDEYLKTSRAGQLLNCYQGIIIRSFAMNIPNRNDRVFFRKSLLELSNKKEILEKFTKGFKELDKSDYKKIMNFYQTNEGNKSVEATYKFSPFHKRKNKINSVLKCKNFLTEDCFKYLDLTNFHLLPVDQKNLIKQVEEYYSIIKFKRDIRKYLLLAMNLASKKSHQFSNEYIQKYAIYNDLNYHQTTKNLTYLYFQDFSKSELEIIVNYASSREGKLEFHLIEDGIVHYTNYLVKKIMLTYYPSKCSIKE